LKRRTLAALLTLLLVALTALPTLADSPKSDVTLSFMTSANWFHDYNQAMFDQFTDETGIKIDVMLIPEDTYRTVLGAKIATGEIPDVVEFFNGGTGRAILQAEKNFLDLSGEPWMQRISPTMIKAFADWDGKNYGFPYTGTGYWGVLYNKQVFKDLGVADLPKTFEEFDALCRKIKDAGIKPLYCGGGDIWPNEIWMDVYWGAYLGHEFPDFMDRYSRNEAKFATFPEFVECLERQNDFYKKGYFGDTVMTDTYDAGHGELYEGKAAMLVFFDLVFGEGIAKYPDFAEKIDMMPMPINGKEIYGIASSNSLYIAKDSPHIAEAKRLLEFLARPEVAEPYYAEQMLSPWWTDLNVDLLPETLRAKERVDKGYGGIIWFDFIPASYGDSSYQQVQEMFMGNVTPVQVAEAMDSEIARDAKAQGLPGW